MCATDMDDEHPIIYPCIVQPKLDGVRAKWDGYRLTSRKLKLWHEQSLPELFETLRTWSRENPGVTLDGELYIPGKSFQEISEVTAIRRIAPHENSRLLEFYAFDIISPEPARIRQQILNNIYPKAVPYVICPNSSLLRNLMTQFLSAGFEGSILRMMSPPYVIGYTEALVKWKPWKHGFAKCVGFSQGKGKYSRVLGALQCELSNGITFSLGSGFSDEQRRKIWYDKHFWMGRTIVFHYRDTTDEGLPRHPIFSQKNLKK